MKLKKLTLACAATMISSQAFALTPAVTPDLNIYISGASAQDKALAALVGNLCHAGTLDTFKDLSATSDGKAYTSYFCTIDSTQVDGMSVDQDVLINKRSAGGSGKGVQVVADAVPIEAMNIFNGNCTETASGSQQWTCTITNTNDLIMQVSDAGISDVEPAMFTDLNTPAGDVAVTPAQVAKLNITSMNAVVFGVPVTEALYRALQQGQGLNTALDDEANMPTLSMAEVNGLITGNLSNWDNYRINGVSLRNIAGVTAPALDLGGRPLVHVCRRVPGSGTQAQMNAVFANAPCAAGVQKTARAPGNIVLGPIVEESSSSGGVTTCLATKNTANKWAIGVQSLEKLDPSFRFVKIDGYAPTLKNVAENKYIDWVETTMQWRTAAEGGPGGDVLNILNTIAKNASTPSTIASLNAAFTHGFGTGAYLALNTNGFAPSFPHDDANPVTTATHAPLGVPNSCNKPTVNYVAP
jgi:hypothetical protein